MERLHVHAGSQARDEEQGRDDNEHFDDVDGFHL